MPRRAHDTLESYTRHAERHGSELIFETAIQDLGVLDLGRLSLALQRIDPKWKLKHCIHNNAADFGAMLVARGESVKRAAEMAQVSTKTVRDHYNEGSYAEMRLESTF